MLHEEFAPASRPRTESLLPCAPGTLGQLVTPVALSLAHRLFLVLPVLPVLPPPDAPFPRFLAVLPVHPLNRPRVVVPSPFFPTSTHPPPLWPPPPPPPPLPTPPNRVFSTISSLFHSPTVPRLPITPFPQAPRARGGCRVSFRFVLRSPILSFALGKLG